MADRADYLARTLIARLGNLEERFAEDERGEPDRRQRIETVEKVLAVELGVADSATTALIEAAVPSSKTVKQGSDRELVEFAGFLRDRLRAHLSEQR
ncbi:MAG TPA: hypothetical protein VEA63_06520 [Opitutus sp.]|nr:hypothetical protein [Opitutus sp.]